MGTVPGGGAARKQLRFSAGVVLSWKLSRLRTGRLPRVGPSVEWSS
jgi:hypothetical protein